MTALVEERRSQVCLGLDPDASLQPEASAEHCRGLIDAAGPACVAVKPQLACFERHGSAGWRALEDVVAAAHDAGLLVVADGKRGDVPFTAKVYAEGLTSNLGADAFTVNPLLGDDATQPFIDAAAAARSGVFVLVRTSNPGAAELQDASLEGRPLHEHLAELVARHAAELAGSSGLSGMGAVIGATAPQHMARLRELMPDSIFLVPGVGAQGGRPEDLGPAFAPGRPASVLVPAARSIAGADDPGAAAEELRSALWEVSAA